MQRRVITGADDAEQAAVVDAQHGGGEGREQRPADEQREGREHRGACQAHARSGQGCQEDRAARRQQEGPDAAPAAAEADRGGRGGLEEALAQVAGPDDGLGLVARQGVGDRRHDCGRDRHSG